MACTAVRRMTSGGSARGSGTIAVWGTGSLWDPSAGEAREMQRGTVTYWNEKKRFGFIHPDDGGADVSYYPAGGAPDVEVGDRVEFEVLARTQVTPSGP